MPQVRGSKQAVVEMLSLEKISIEVEIIVLSTRNYFKIIVP